MVFLKISRTEGRGGIDDLTFRLKLCIDIYVSTRSYGNISFYRFRNIIFN